MLTLAFERRGGTTRITVGPRGTFLSVATEEASRLVGALGIPFPLSDIEINATEAAQDTFSSSFTVTAFSVPAAFADGDWSLTDAAAAPAQFAPGDWSLADT